jgi:ribose transport system substrate-binding protein
MKTGHFEIRPKCFQRFSTSFIGRNHLMKKKALSVVLSLAIAGTLLAGCGGSGSSSQPASNAGAAQTGDAAATDGGSMDIRIISKSFNNQFYQAAFKGANDAAADLGVTVTTNGPDVETNTSQQVEQVKAAVNAIA